MVKVEVQPPASAPSASAKAESKRKKEFKLEVAKKRLLNTMGDGQKLDKSDRQDAQLDLYRFDNDKFINGNTTLSEDLKDELT